MRLILFADGAVGLGIAEWLVENWRHDICLIVTISDNEISDLAHRNSLPCHIFSTESHLVDYLQQEDAHPDLGLLAWWPHLLREPLLTVPSSGFINTHPSLLPYNRGKHYNFWAIVEQSPFGVTLHRVNNSVDSGDIIAQGPIPYGWEDTGATLYQKAQSAMIDLVRDTYPTLRHLNFEARPQTEGIGSHHRASELHIASKIHLDRTYTGRELLNLLRARTFPPHPGCWFSDAGVDYEVRVEITKRVT